MALPLAGALPGIIVAIWEGLKYILKFVFDWIKRRLGNITYYGMVITICYFSFGILVSYFAYATDFYFELRNKIQEFIYLLGFKNTNSEVGNLARDILGSARFFEAFNDVLNTFSPLFFFMFVSLCCFLLLKVLHMVKFSILSLVVAKG